MIGLAALASTRGEPRLTQTGQTRAVATESPHGRTVALLINTGSPRRPLDTVMKAAS
jgi:hypothetical protein